MATMEMDYTTIYQVIDCWERLRRIPNYEEVAGTILFQRLFEKCPPIKALFGFPITMNTSSAELLNSKRFLKHASYMIQMLDKALNMLGPDVELLAEILSDLGKKHAKFGVKEEYFPLMGEALHEMFQEALGDNYTDDDSLAWTSVYGGLSTAMCKAMDKELAVIKSWEKLKSINNYQEVAGSILFQNLFVKCPSAKALFGFPVAMDPTSEIMLNSRRFKMHAAYFIEMLDKTMNMMEKDKLEENMAELGKIHLSYGVKEEYFPVMGEALIHTLRELLGGGFSKELEECWVDVYETLSREMLTAMRLK